MCWMSQLLLLRTAPTAQLNFHDFFCASNTRWFANRSRTLRDQCWWTISMRPQNESPKGNRFCRMFERVLYVMCVFCCHTEVPYFGMYIVCDMWCTTKESNHSSTVKRRPHFLTVLNIMMQQQTKQTLSKRGGCLLCGGMASWLR